MALEPLAKEGHFFHIYDFRVKPGTGEEFIALFNAFDYSDENPMHKSPAQVKDGVLCRDVSDPDRFWLIGEWRDIAVHAEIRKLLAEKLRPEFIRLIEGGKFVPDYARIVSSTPQDVLDKAAR
ncbi:MAG: putative quinol monooxygenase [Alphaproteobacteria bacterium]